MSFCLVDFLLTLTEPVNSLKFSNNGDNRQSIVTVFVVSSNSECKYRIVNLQDASSTPVASISASAR